MKKKLKGGMRTHYKVEMVEKNYYKYVMSLAKKKELTMNEVMKISTDLMKFRYITLDEVNDFIITAL